MEDQKQDIHGHSSGNGETMGYFMNIEELQNKIKMQESIIENLRNGLQQLAAENHALTARIAEYENTNNQNSLQES